MGKILLPTKVMLVWGDKDATCPPSSAHKLRSLLGRPAIRWLAGGGHCALQEFNEKASEWIGNFLSPVANARPNMKAAAQRGPKIGLLHEAAANGTVTQLVEACKQAGGRVDCRNNVTATVCVCNC